ncbi:aspartyl-phosphate phosphatase Spo0E family protein [Mesobacillus maritimus]|uniref:Aspartyl-phosphate phosphatase Spo0E family protein n=2 Tax=Mesobacillus maritimus TaxID=1643336 RepID=A0ABS7K0U8_9BACI|nr:aspartyl-phosphate phosphatase Spo0E family protein [Mesobacillus maritimus]
MLTMYENLQQIIEVKRNQMTNLASVKGISSDEALKISQDLDKLIMLAMKYKTKH